MKKEDKILLVVFILLIVISSTIVSLINLSNTRAMEEGCNAIGAEYYRGNTCVKVVNGKATLHEFIEHKGKYYLK